MSSQTSKLFLLIGVIIIFPIIIQDSFAEEQEVKYEIYSYYSYNKIFDLSYHIENGKVTEIINNSEKGNSLLFTIDNYGDAVLTLKIYKIFNIVDFGCSISKIIILDYKSGDELTSTLVIDENAINVKIELDDHITELEIVPRSDILTMLQYDNSCSNFMSLVKYDMKEWHNGKISDNHIATIIKTLFQKNMLFTYFSHIAKEFESSNTVEIPDWLKTPAKWWSEDKITEKEFLSLLNYMINTGEIKFVQI